MPSIGLAATLPFTISGFDAFGRVIDCVKTFALMSSDPAVYNQQDGRPVPQGSACEVNGTNYGLVTLVTSVNIYSLSEWSLEVDVNSLTFDSGNYWVVSLGSSSSNTPYFGIRSDSGSGNIRLQDRDDSSGSNLNQIFTTNINDGAWHRVSIIVAGGFIKGIIDGVEDFSVPTPSGSLTVDQIGLSCFARPVPTSGFSGKLSNFRALGRVYPLQGTFFDVSNNDDDLIPINSPTFPKDQTIPVDYLNDNGFTEGNGSNGAAIGEYIPALIDGSGDAAGNATQWQGRAYPLQWGRTGGAALSFNGTNYVTIPCSEPSFPFEISFYAENTSAAALLQVAGFSSDTSASRYYSIGVDPDDRIAVTRRSVEDGNDQVTASISSPPRNVRVVFHNDTDFDIYNNGFLELSTVGAPSVRVTGLNQKIIGSLRSISPTSSFEGVISAVNIGDSFASLSEGAGSSVYASDGTVGALVNSPTWVNTSPVFTNATEGFSLLDTGARVAYVNGAPNPVTAGLNVVSEHPFIEDHHNNSENELTAMVADDGNYPPAIAQMDFPPIDFRPQDGALPNVSWRNLGQNNFDRITLTEESSLTQDELDCLTDYLQQGTEQIGITIWLDTETWDDSETWTD